MLRLWVRFLSGFDFGGVTIFILTFRLKRVEVEILSLLNTFPLPTLLYAGKGVTCLKVTIVVKKWDKECGFVVY